MQKNEHTCWYGFPTCFHFMHLLQRTDKYSRNRLCLRAIRTREFSLGELIRAATWIFAGRRHQAVNAAHRRELIALTPGDRSRASAMSIRACSACWTWTPVYCSVCFIPDQYFDKSASKLDKLSLGFVTSLGRDNLFIS